MEYIEIFVKLPDNPAMYNDVLGLGNAHNMDYIILPHGIKELYLKRHAIVERSYLESLEKQIKEYEEELDQLRFEVKLLKEELNK